MILYRSAIPPQRSPLVKAIAAIAAAHLCVSAAYAQKALDEVIVTAQKKDDTLQTVPMTVNAVTADTISKYNLLDFKDIQSVTPGLTIKAQDTRTATIAMRGVNVLTDSGFGPGVALYWNEVVSDIDTLFKAMYDVGQIEVLRGPQGTLRGVTAPAGAVTINSKGPSFSEIEGTVEQTFGERDLSNTQFGVSLPVIEDKLALRLAGLYDYNKNEDIENVANGKENRSLTSSGRITLGLRATDNLEATLVHQYLESLTAGNLPMVGCGSPQSNIHDCFDASDRKAVNPNQATTFQRRNETALRVEWDLNKYLLTSVTGYRVLVTQPTQDQDFGNVLPPTVINSGTGQPGSLVQIGSTKKFHQFSQELRLSSQDEDFYNWTYGAYAQRIVAHTLSQPQTWIRVYLEPTPGNFRLFRTFTRNANVFVYSFSEEYAAFTNQSFQWTDNLETQFGLRYQSKRGVTTLSGATSFASKSVDEGVTGNASISYQLTDGTRLYATYGRSFRPGGFTVATQTPEEFAEYGPETSDSIELGFKSRLADGRLQVNGDVYYQKYTDFLARTPQAIRSVGGSTGVGNNFLNFNADAVSQGAELQIDALLTDDWQMGLGISYNDSKFTGGKMYCNLFDASGVVINPTANPATGHGINTCDATGRVAGEPNWSANATSDYTMHWGAVDSFVRTQFNFASGRSDDSLANSVLDTSSYGLWNLFAGVRDPGKTWEITVWAKNLFDKEQVVRISPEATVAATAVSTTGHVVPDTVNAPLRSGYYQVQVVPERQFGITGKYNFSL